MKLERSAKAANQVHLPSRALAIKIAAAYVAVGALWILCSDWVLHALVRDHRMAARLELLKGWWFVLATAVLWGVALDRYFRVIRESAHRLREGEKRWQHALAGASQAVWDWNPETGEVFYSPEWKAMLGFAPEAVGNQCSEWENLVHPDDHPRVMQVLRDHLEGRTAQYAAEYRIRCQDGGYKWILDQGKVTDRGLDGRPLRVVGTHFDISERRRAEERNQVQHDLTLALAACTQLEDGLKRCLDAAIQLAGMDSGGVYLLDAQTGTLRLAVHRGLSAEFVEAVGHFGPESTQARIVAEQRPVYGEFESLDLELSAPERSEGLRAVAVVPFVYKGCAIGCLNVSSHQRRELSTEDRTGIETIAAGAAQAILRLRAQAALAVEATRRRILVEGSRDGIVVVNQEGGVYEANRRFCEMLGYTPEEVLELHVWDWDGRWTREQLMETIRALGPDGDHFETLHRRKDGSVYEVEISSNGAEVEGQKMIFCVCRDITERRHSQAALHSALAKYKTLFESFPMAVTVVDREFRFVEVNSVAAKMLGLSNEALGHRRLDDGDWRVLRSDGTPMPAGEFPAIRAQRENRRVENFAMGLVRPSGDLVWIEATAAPVPLPDHGVVVAYVDISERKRHERRTRQEAVRNELLLSLHQQAPQMTDRELFDYVLDKAVRLTESEIGFFHQVSEDQKFILLTTWNRAALNQCTAAFESHYPLSEAGNWVDCVRLQRPVVYNDFAQSPNQRGLPPGHSALHRFMSIPVVQEGRVRIIFGVGNKALDYDEEDVAQLQVVANELHKLMTHRAAESQLRQLSRAVEQSAASVVIADRSGIIEYVNPKFTQVSGHRLEEVRGRDPLTLVQGAIAPRGQQDLWKAIEEGREWRGEFRNQKKNGEWHWESASISPIADASGEVTHVVAVKEDITERKRLESFREALLALGARLNKTADALGAGRALLHAADQLWQWDAATLDLVEPECGQVRSVMLIDTLDGRRQEFPSEGVKPLTPLVERVGREGAVLLLRGGTGQPAAGESVPFGDVSRPSASIMCVPIRREAALVGVLSIQSYVPKAYGRRDLETLQALADYCGGALERIRSQEALRRGEERYRHLVETTFDWIWEMDADGRYVYASPKVKDLLGYTPDEVIGRTPFDFMPEPEARRVEAVFRRFADQRKPFSSVENTNLHRDGRLVILETSAMPVLGPGGELLGYRGIDRDVSERRRLEVQLRQAQKLEAVGQLAGGVAHDFNNILAAFMMHLGMLRMHANLDAETVEALKELDKEAQRGASLTRQLLMFSRRSVLAVKPLDLNRVVRDVLNMLSRLIGENLMLRFEGLEDLPAVEADIGMVEQVLMNLVVNARDAMPGGGQITIRTGVEEVGEVAVTLNPNRRLGRFVCLTVSDTGMGMDEATQKRIFEPFFTTKEAGKGTGLGLATVHGIVAQHRGWVEVESEVGRGSTFRVLLPAFSRPAPSAVESPSGHALPGGKETVLLVEDESHLRRTVSRALRAIGYSVYEAANGQEAMRLWQEHGVTVDLLLTDIVMPEGMSGVELAQHLRGLNPRLKAIISTGYSAEALRSGLPSGSGVTYLPKPYDVSRLAQVVRECLDGRPGGAFSGSGRGR